MAVEGLEEEIEVIEAVMMPLDMAIEVVIEVEETIEVTMVSKEKMAKKVEIRTEDVAPIEGIEVIEAATITIVATEMVQRAQAEKLQTETERNCIQIL